MNDKIRVRLFEIMNECERVNISKIIKWLDSLNCKYLIVKHDKDTPRTPHYHCFVSLKNARTLEDISKHCDVEQQYINFIRNWKNALAYAFHKTSKSIDDGKAEYDANAVVSSCGVELDQIFKVAESYRQNEEYDLTIEQLFYEYGECSITKKELFKHLDGRLYNKYSRLYKNMRELRIEKVKNRDMVVIYITGGSGSGKTTLAKFMAQASNYDYFVSGSGADILDGYDKEECIILDDLRADIFTKAELFKLTDNNTNSSVKSRFKNKDISYCRLMIITSIKKPDDLYNWNTDDFENKDETFKQFSRRISNKFLMIRDDGTIKECFYDTDGSARLAQINDSPFNMSQVFATLGIFASIGKDATTLILNNVAERLKNSTKNNSDLLTELNQDK